MTDDQDQRLNRALAAYLRQEVQAPAMAIADFLDILIEDARRLGADAVLGDLERMQGAGARLNAFVGAVVTDSAADRKLDENDHEFNRRLRHDLRTPLNAIIGYSEMLIEDMDGDAHAPMRDDLIKLKQAADQLLGQIDAMVALTHIDDAPIAREDKLAAHAGIVADVLRTVQPLKAEASHLLDRQSRILIVDDNAANRDVLERRLAREGHAVVTAANGVQALKLVGDEDFDLVLLDLIMPELSGFDVLTRLKGDDATRHIPVIVISALDELDSVVRCIEAGAEDFLSKPFDPILLRTRINSSLEKKWLRDREKKFVADLETEKRKSETLLLNILPHSIVRRMREGELKIADQVHESTILFCDLAGFTMLSGTMSAEDVLDFLGEIFTQFDALAAEAGVEKIKTIGDAYMAAAGIPEPQPDHAHRIARLAPRMMRAVRDVARTTGLKLEARIGIHTGPIVAGVIGTHKFAYDVWGDSVNTASRMESHSVNGRIHISEATRRALGEAFPLEPRGVIEVKGKGPMQTYFLLEP
ncbi:adenylate/guanylate cyclase domain-containing protein [Undibacter mobilis]|uniref:histidine kinase n=1 Tax=Undibacter mobilis TaxID=2292256 RepID=A0A371BBK6_9BRAD|nr:adenylate/guanylate cyclase domain-containing protein [Undibacter mobilis]RDV04958.1 response regulator [Undibacter mobilis]